ncbi:hypothetical protein CPA50_11995 [Marinobacter sp. ANT_B65]|nr:hypothetical protein CPA50_11995 [Marinobacter sp. ANT_B65]
MKRIRDTEFIRTLPESIAYLLSDFSLYIGLFVALIGSVYIGSWWAFPVIFLLFIALGWGLVKLSTNYRKRKDG